NEAGTGRSTSSSPAQDTGGVVTFANDSGIIVSLVREPSAQTNGIINVTVPKDMSAASQGFSFPLPEQAAPREGAGRLSVKTINGDSLPGWLRFDPDSRSFTATAVPSGGLPLHVVVSTGDMEV